VKLTQQKSWQDIAQSKGMTYLQCLPEAIPEGQFLVHKVTSVKLVEIGTGTEAP
jgi:hypothetical protein